MEQIRTISVWYLQGAGSHNRKALFPYKWEVSQGYLGLFSAIYHLPLSRHRRQLLFHGKVSYSAAGRCLQYCQTIGRLQREPRKLNTVNFSRLLLQSNRNLNTCLGNRKETFLMENNYLQCWSDGNHVRWQTEGSNCRQPGSTHGYMESRVKQT